MHEKTSCKWHIALAPIRSRIGENMKRVKSTPGMVVFRVRERYIKQEQDIESAVKYAKEHRGF